MTSDIDSAIVLCKLCNSTKPHKQREPLVIYLVPDLPWLFVSEEILNWNGLRYLIPVDSYSGLLATDTLRDLSSITVIKRIKLGIVLLSMMFIVKCFLPVVHNLQVENFKGLLMNGALRMPPAFHIIHSLTVWPRMLSNKPRTCFASVKRKVLIPFLASLICLMFREIKH